MPIQECDAIMCIFILATVPPLSFPLSNLGHLSQNEGAHDLHCKPACEQGMHHGESQGEDDRAFYSKLKSRDALPFCSE